MTSIRDLAASDIGWLLALNNASVPHVNHLDRESLSAIVAKAGYARMVLSESQPAGALIGLWPGTDYDSDNYRWFSEQFEHFLYIDRVMIAASVRQAGLGRALYDDIERFARLRKTPRLACEVNSKPPNPGSMRFHQAAGFQPVGEQASEAGTKRVVMLVKSLTDDPG